jgi:hypothetical protein
MYAHTPRCASKTGCRDGMGSHEQTVIFLTGFVFAEQSTPEMAECKVVGWKKRKRLIYLSTKKMILSPLRLPVPPSRHFVEVLVSKAVSLLFHFRAQSQLM